jgi:hypothetical protein
MMVFTAAMLLIITFLAVDVVAWHRAHRIKEPESIRELEQQNPSSTSRCWQLDPSVPGPRHVSSWTATARLAARAVPGRATGPGRTLMEQGLWWITAPAPWRPWTPCPKLLPEAPTRGWDVDHDAIALMFERPVVTIHAVADVLHQEPERVRCLLSSLGIAWDPMADTVPGRSVYRLCQKQRMGLGHEQSAPRTHTRRETQ